MIPTERPIPDRDGPRDECGVFGVYAPGHDVARLAYFALYALQHRGQESAGIATCEGGHITTLRDTGLVSQVFDEEKLRALDGDMAIGHVRYSTTGGGSWENTQPVWRDDGREVALAHNGNLTNAVELYNELRERGIAFRGTSDSEIIAALLSVEEARPIENAVAAVMPRLEGAYSTVVMTKRAVVAFRDPHGVRPLSLGKLGDRYCVASESCAFDIIGAELLREVHAGRAGLADRARARDAAGGAAPTAPRTASSSTSTSPGRTRGSRAGCCSRCAGGWARSCWRESPVDADLVISVPDSGNPAANGYARASGLPAGRRADQEPLRRPDLHPARPGAAQARPADEVQPAARDRRRQARRRRRRLDRARQHDPPDRRHAARRRARRRSTCGSRRRRSATPATTGSTCRPARR